MMARWDEDEDGVVGGIYLLSEGMRGLDEAGCGVVSAARRNGWQAVRTFQACPREEATCR